MATTLHEKIKAHVIRGIHDGTWLPGQRLPSEHQLVSELGVSRMTVNKALRELAGAGRIVRIAGVGSFVAEAKPQSTLLQIATIANEIRARGHEHSWHCLSRERIAAPPDVAVWLDMIPGQSIFHMASVHFENGVPIQLEDRYVNPKMVPDFLDQDFSHSTPGEILLATVPADLVEHVVDAVMPTPEQARILDMQASEPCLQLTRRTWSRDVPVTWVRCLNPASRYSLGSRFRPGPDH
ncbi:histidine utilization repressor [Bordetella sp. BOR01]|uniref:histidine utilization repressor n=1 Tax=Bordetella sp. BOR01 TaxID=2854779 RepID=UPI001C48E50C|nr:histidine utilization repressor [Bordetella sp. BOR01]MBV7482120.1 histidine utilization repressor [Bordetella sp. BOR01]